MSLKIFIAPLVTLEATCVKFRIDEESKQLLNNHQKENRWIKTLIFRKIGEEDVSSPQMQTVNENSILDELKNAIQIGQAEEIVRLILVNDQEYETERFLEIIEELKKEGVKVCFVNNERMQSEQILRFKNKNKVATSN